MSVKFVRPVLDPFQKKQVWITLLGPLVPGVIGAAGIIVTVLCLKENPISTGFFIFQSRILFNYSIFFRLWGMVNPL